MTRLEYRVLQYREEPDRGEGRNFALIAHDGFGRHVAAVGLDRAGKIDYGALESLVRRNRDGAWVFAEWIGWLRALADSGSDAEIDQALDPIERSQRFIVALPAEIAEYPGTVDIAAAMDDLRHRVLYRPRRRSQGFAERVEESLARAKLKQLKGFDRDVEVAFSPAGAVTTIANFPFVISGDKRKVFKTIAFTGRKDHLSRQVNDARRSFEMAIESGFATPDDCVVLTDGIPEASRTYARTLAEIARLVDINDEKAMAELV